MSRNQLCLIFSLTLVALIGCNPKKYMAHDESVFEPSNNRYYESSLPSSNYHREPVRNSTKPERKDSHPHKDSRFGIIPVGTSYGSTGSGVNYNGNNGNANGVTYTVSPMKIDLGGVALGALIGLGAILIVPKIAHVLSGGLGGYRSLEGETSTVSDILARIDNSLEQNNMDSTSCVQRIICTYVNDAEKNMKNGEARGIDEFVSSLANNTLFTYALDKTSLKEAVDLGKRADVEKCSSFYSKCPITRESILKVMSSLLPA